MPIIIIIIVFQPLENIPLAPLYIDIYYGGGNFLTSPTLTAHLVTPLLGTAFCALHPLVKVLYLIIICLLEFSYG